MKIFVIESTYVHSYAYISRDARDLFPFRKSILRNLPQFPRYIALIGVEYTEEVRVRPEPSFPVNSFVLKWHVPCVERHIKLQNINRGAYF